MKKLSIIFSFLNEGIMSIDNFKIILDKLIKEKGNLIDPNWTNIYFHHFNEFLLYPHIEEIFKILRKN